MWRAFTGRLMEKGLRVRLTWRFRSTFSPKNMSHRWVHFTDEEVKGLDESFVALLDRARHIANLPFVVTSGRRSHDENERAMGAEGSSHLKGFAADLACSDSGSRFAMVRALLEVGIKRIGVYDRHVHCDVDPDKSPSVMWLGKST